MWRQHNAKYKMNQGAERRLRLLGRWSQAGCTWGEVLFLRSNSKNISKANRCLSQAWNISCYSFELLPGGDAADWVQRARTGGHLPQTWLQVSFYSCFFLFYCFYVCRLVSNNTDCLTTDIPTEVCLSLWIIFVSNYLRQSHCSKHLQVRLEDQVCEECKHGRTKLRPGLVQVCPPGLV